ncbi:MAG TPA: MFS transporter [Candidatus Limnocylindrales bacterium]|nr:MFS transporter [Candidatus Limnocylindrales bacterium]
MDSRARIVLLAVFGTGVFLAGLELMITAVALPSILADLVAANGTSAWIELRKASWIINGYLLVYILMMPLAGRLADLWGARRLFLAALAIFTVGSTLAGLAQDLDQLIAARLVQAVGGGVLVPVGTAAAAHLFEAAGRPRALGVVGALTFLGMAAGPFLGAAVLSSIHPEIPLIEAGLGNSTLTDLLAPAWRWIFFANLPIAVTALAVAWAVAPGWDTPRRSGRIDLAGAAIFGLALAAGLVALTLIGATSTPDAVDPFTISVGLGAVAAVATLLAIVRAVRQSDPFLDVRLFRERAFTAAAVVSALTGYAFATAIIGGAVFVDRVLYGGPDEQRFALGSLAGATAIGALVSGFAVRFASYRVVTIVGLAASVVGLALMSRWSPASTIGDVAAALALFGMGFGLSVTPRSTAAVEAAGRAAFGAASSVVTVARMLGMAVGLAVLTAYGSTTIDRLSAEVYATPDAYLAYIPESLRDRPLKDPLVVEALESWASREAASIMVGLYLVAALVTVAAAPPALAMGGGGAGRRARSARMLAADGAPDPGLIL